MLFRDLHQLRICGSLTAFQSDAKDKLLFNSVQNENANHILADHVAVEVAALSENDDEEPQFIKNDLTNVEPLDDDLTDTGSSTISRFLLFSFSTAWAIPDTLSSDWALILTLKRLTPAPEPISLSISDLDILWAPDVWLNSGCIDTSGAWIQILLAKSSPKTQQCAIFSTLVFPKTTGGHDLVLWTLI
ncbi:hypothetical protein C8J56DRAFT_1037289 [Mycena floridula]|nr:hypothetical protein C8J56DRAFT_1037289 [Mycena floridula]